MQNLYVAWHLKHIFQKKNLTNSIKYLLFIAFISFSRAEEKPIKINITGNVLDKDVAGLKGTKLVIENKDGEQLEKEKSEKEGKFKFKKVKLFPGEYILKGNHKTKGYGEIKFFVDSTDIELTLVIPTKKEDPIINVDQQVTLFEKPQEKKNKKTTSNGVKPLILDKQEEEEPLILKEEFSQPNVEKNQIKKQASPSARKIAEEQNKINRFIN